MIGNYLNGNKHPAVTQITPSNLLQESNQLHCVVLIRAGKIEILEVHPLLNPTAFRDCKAKP